MAKRQGKPDLKDMNEVQTGSKAPKNDPWVAALSIPSFLIRLFALVGATEQALEVVAAETCGRQNLNMYANVSLKPMLRAEVGNLLQKGKQVLVHFVCSSIPSIGCSSVPNMQLVDPALRLSTCGWQLCKWWNPQTSLRRNSEGWTETRILHWSGGLII